MPDETAYVSCRLCEESIRVPEGKRRKEEQAWFVVHCPNCAAQSLYDKSELTTAPRAVPAAAPQPPPA